MIFFFGVSTGAIIVRQQTQNECIKLLAVTYQFYVVFYHCEIFLITFVFIGLIESLNIL